MGAHGFTDMAVNPATEHTQRKLVVMVSGTSFVGGQQSEGP